jgi:acyl-coenzyme A synthetase/AMP-(fatty) acid ligase
MPDECDDAITRPMAFVVAPRLSRETVLERLRQRLDPVFLPRPLYLVRALPRNATGKLPREMLAALAARCAAGGQPDAAPLPPEAGTESGPRHPESLA